MNEEALKFIESNSDVLKDLTLWVFITFVALLFSVINNTTEEYFQLSDAIKINKNKSGLIIYLVLVCINFYILKQYNNIYSLYLNNENLRHKISIQLQSNDWLFNPFSRTQTKYSLWTDNLGITFNILLWWTGNAVGLFGLLKQSDWLKFIGLGISFLYILIGACCVTIITVLVYQIGTDEMLSDIVYIHQKFLFIKIGAYLGFVIFCLINGKPLFFFVDNKFKQLLNAFKK